MANWSPLNDGDKYGLMASMSLTVADIERAEGDFLPNLRTDSELVLVSDYAGASKHARFQTLTFLLADRPGILRTWDFERKVVRRKFLQDQRRIAFKNLGDRSKQRALGSFLTAAESINGILFTIAIEKAVESISFQRLPSASDIAAWSQLPWTPRVFEKLVRVLHFCDSPGLSDSGGAWFYAAISGA